MPLQPTSAPMKWQGYSEEHCLVKKLVFTARQENSRSLPDPVEFGKAVFVLWA